jgi:hypothetical protein
MIKDDAIKSLAVAGPLFASTLAVTYDVGFFYGSDIGFFTFFSFTEHVVFALQAAPFAIPTAAALAGWVFGSWVGHQQGKEMAAKLIEAEDAERQKAIERSEKIYKRILGIQPYLMGFLIALGLANLGNENYTSAITSLLSAFAVRFFPTVVDLKAKPSLQIITGGALVVSALLLAFSFGYDRARIVVKSTTPTETIYVGYQAIPARLIRSGDKGVLFYSIDTKRIRFLRWESIKQIESA